MPSGLSQGSLLIPWLLSTISIPDSISELSWWNGGLFVCSVCFGMFIGFFTLLQQCWRDLSGKQSGIGTCLMGYLITILGSLAMLHDIGHRLLLNGFCWIGLSVCLFTIQLHQLSECFSIGEMIVCAELLASLFWFVLTGRFSIPQESLDTMDSQQLLYCICCWISVSLLVSVFTCLAVRQWTVDWLHGTRGVTFHKRKNQLFSLLVHAMSLLSFGIVWSMRSSLFEIVAFSFVTKQRRWLMVYWLVIVGLGVWSAQILKVTTQTIIMRKWFHFVAICLFLPACFLEPIFLQIALGGALAVFFLAEGIRLACIPGVSPVINRFLSAFTDHRDNGPIIFSHFSLLIGLALPIWIAPVVGTHPDERQVLSLSGLMGLGIGDAFAAIIGTWYPQSLS